MTESTIRNKKIGPFSEGEVRGLMMVLGVGIVLGVAVEATEALVPRRYRACALMPGLCARESAGKSDAEKFRRTSFDAGRPELKFGLDE